MPKQVDFSQMEWQATPYPGVFVSCLEEEGSGEIPDFTSHAVRLDVGSKIGPHYHEREPGWMELILFPDGGDFEFRIDGQVSEYSTQMPVYRKIRPREVYGIRNRNRFPLYFFSFMKPGFSGFQDI